MTPYPIATLRWAPRVPLNLIRRLYQSDARGLRDEELLEEVGIALYARCESILRLTDAYIRGLVICPACGGKIQIAVEGRHRNRTMAVRCNACGWETTWLAFKHAFDDKRLHAGNAGPVFREYMGRYPHTKTPAEKMRLIDWLLHEFHKIRGRGESGLAASNLLEGNWQQVLAFLDELAGFRPEEDAGEWRRRLQASGTGRRIGYTTHDE